MRWLVWSVRLPWNELVLWSPFSFMQANADCLWGWAFSPKLVCTRTAGQLLCFSSLLNPEAWGLHVEWGEKKGSNLNCIWLWLLFGNCFLFGRTYDILMHLHFATRSFDEAPHWSWLYRRSTCDFAQVKDLAKHMREAGLKPTQRSTLVMLKTFLQEKLVIKWYLILFCKDLVLVLQLQALGSHPDLAPGLSGAVPQGSTTFRGSK